MLQKSSKNKSLLEKSNRLTDRMSASISKDKEDIAPVGEDNIAVNDNRQQRVPKQHTFFKGRTKQTKSLEKAAALNDRDEQGSQAALGNNPEDSKLIISGLLRDYTLSYNCQETHEYEKFLCTVIEDDDIEPIISLNSRVTDVVDIDVSIARVTKFFTTNFVPGDYVSSQPFAEVLNSSKSAGVEVDIL